jgi:MinD-like ATPase involved in chromosome partitioning or flagellar assembly
MSSFLAFASPKGGVGKTTLATNVASLLNSAGKQVLIADLNMNSPDVAQHFGESHTRTIVDVLKGHVPLSGAVYKHKSGLKMLPAAQNSHSQNLFKGLHKLLPSLVEHADWVIADFPPRHDALSSSLLSTFDKVAIVTAPDRLSIARAVEMAKSLDTKSCLVMNRADDKPSAQHHVLAGIIPEDKEIHAALQLGLPVVDHHPHARSSHCLRKLCHALTGIKTSAHRTKALSLIH